MHMKFACHDKKQSANRLSIHSLSRSRFTARSDRLSTSLSYRCAPGSQRFASHFVHHRESSCAKILSVVRNVNACDCAICVVCRARLRRRRRRATRNGDARATSARTVPNGHGFRKGTKSRETPLINLDPFVDNSEYRPRGTVGERGYKNSLPKSFASISADVPQIAPSTDACAICYAYIYVWWNSSTTQLFAEMLVPVSSRF